MIMTTAETRQIDQRAPELLGIPSLLLMENAGRSLVEALVACHDTPLEQLRILLCCGKGNNGGDGFVMARRLCLLKAQVEVVAVGTRESYTGDAAVNLAIFENIVRQLSSQQYVTAPKLSFFEQEEVVLARFKNSLSRADWIVDALLGTGATGPLRSPYDLIVKQINRSNKPVFAVDLPTGLDADTGTGTEQAVRATVTCTLATMKPGLLASKAKDNVGKLVVGDIGISPHWVVREVTEKQGDT